MLLPGSVQYSFQGLHSPVFPQSNIPNYLNLTFIAIIKMAIKRKLFTVTKQTKRIYFIHSCVSHFKNFQRMSPLYGIDVGCVLSTAGSTYYALFKPVYFVRTSQILPHSGHEQWQVMHIMSYNVMTPTLTGIKITYILPLLLFR